MTTTTEPVNPLVVSPMATPKTLNHQRKDGLVDFYGHCMPWCFYPNELGEGRGGHSVEDHGLWCQRTIGSVEAKAIDGRRAYCEVTLSRPYMHGTYRSDEAAISREHYIELHFDSEDEERSPAFLSVGEARRMIAMLQRAADELDGLNRPLSTEEKR